MNMPTDWKRIVIAAALFIIIGLAGCAPAAEPAKEPAEVEMVGIDPSILQDETRPENEVAQDSHRKAIDVYDFLGIQSGMTVADLWPGAGYNTHLMSRAVGDSGKVLSVLGFYSDGQYATKDKLIARIADSALTNVQLLDKLADMPHASVDVALTVRNYHDLYNPSDPGPEAAVASIFRAMKSGGVVGIVDVATDREGWDTETHRINAQVVIDDFTGGGFELVGKSELLTNADDDHSTSGFEAGRHAMDRYLLKFRKADGAGQ